MSEKIDHKDRIIGILLIIAILIGGGGIIYKAQKQIIGEPPAQIQAEPINAENQKPKLINISTASQEELESLPGIGPTKAKAIIEYRDKYGHFGVKKDIIKVKGIGEKTYEKISGLIEI
ncbi:MAG: helix-hairpin-helix domain-containing protein [Candidatus Berkelbacteria bacterium]|nr:helix-hairpin-helix domain-containing protein [Candidatus Berkelbacteria bacterium]